MEKSDPGDAHPVSNQKNVREPYLDLLQHHLNEMKQLVAENGKLSLKNEELQEQIKRMEQELEEFRSQNHRFHLRKYVSVILTLVFLAQIANLIL